MSNANFFLRNTFFCGSLHCAAVFFSQVSKLCTDLDLSLLYILRLGTYSKFTRKNNFIALGVWCPQPCSCAGRRFAAKRSRYSTTNESFRYLPTNPTSNNTTSHMGLRRDHTRPWTQWLSGRNRSSAQCFTVSGASHYTADDTLDSVGDQPSAEILNPNNSTWVRKSSVFEPWIRSSCSRNVSNTAVNFTKCSDGSSEDSVHMSKSSQ